MFLLVLPATGQYSLNLLQNGNLEDYTGSQDDNATDAFSSWTISITDDMAGNRVESTGDASEGANAVKITRTTGGPNFYQVVSGLPLSSYYYKITYKTKSVSSYYGRYRIYDATNSQTWNPTTSTWGGTVYTNLVSNTSSYVGGTVEFQKQATSEVLWLHYVPQGGTAGIFFLDDIKLQQRLDTLYISANGSDAALGDMDNPIATIAEALDRGFYDGGVFAFRSGDTFNETFTAGNNCTLAVYGGASAVTITTIDANSFAVAQSALINPVTDKKPGYGGFNGFK